jgi:hypothetical protein
MPLPFSFSTQRHGFDGESSDLSGAKAVSEMVMQQSFGHISTEPLLPPPGNTFSPPLMNGAEAHPLLAADSLQPAHSPHQRPAADPELLRIPVLLADTPQLFSPLLQAPSRPVIAPTQDWSGQIEQLRSDIFSIATNVSAMNDRIDRLDPRGAQVAGLASLRIEIETWLENHLHAAVEHCMHRIMSRTAPPDAASSN